jgi:hypothetical protein
VDDVIETTGEGEFVGLIAGARRLGELRWVERRLFELVGSWVVGAPDPATKAWLATSSLHHAWHGELLAGVLPTVPNVEGVAPDDLTVAPAVSSDLGRLLGEVDPPAGSSLPGTVELVERYAALVLPGLVGVHRALRDALSPVGDRPAARVLDLVLADELDDLGHRPPGAGS